MGFTPCQQKGSDAYQDFLFSDAQIFVLSGSAGVGKTYLMDHLGTKSMEFYENHCALIEERPQFVSTIFTATTNKAAEVLERAIAKPVSTIHAFLGLKVEEDYKTGKTFLRRTKQRIVENAVLFIDEASMIDQELYDAIMESCSKAKVVFVGDHAQMSPVNENLSPIYKNVDQEHFVFLTTPVRNAETPALMKLCDQLRNSVETGEFYPIEEVPGVIDYLDGASMEREIQKAFVDNTEDARILCYSNQRVQNFNAALREMRNLPVQYMPGEKLVAARAYFNKPNSIAVERTVTVMETQHDRTQEGFAQYTPDGQEIEAYWYKVSKTDDHDNTFSIKVPADADIAKQAMTKMKRAKDWPQYFNFTGQFADLRPVDACTVYKAQGSTYDTAFIDIGNIGTCYDAEQVARMLFVAASRARKRICLFGKLPSKYLGRSVA